MRNTRFVGYVLALLAGCGDGDSDTDLVISTLDFGQTDCGTTAIPRVLTVTNNSPNALTFTIENTAGANSFYTVVPATGVVLPRSQVNVTVHSRGIPQVSPVTDNLYGETLVVTTSDDRTSEVVIKQTAHGAVLGVSGTLDFATPQPFGAAAQTQALTITNAGNAPATVAVTSTSTAFTFTSASPEIEAGGTLAGTVNYFSTATSLERGTLEVSSTGAICAGTAVAVASGTGTAKGLASKVVPTMDRGRPRNATGALCVLTTNGFVACTGSNAHGMRGTTDAHLAVLSGVAMGGGGNGGGGFSEFGTFNLVETSTGVLSQVTELMGLRSGYCAQRQNGDVLCWGAFDGTNNQGQTPTVHPAAVPVAAGSSHLAGGYSTRCIAKTTGGVQCTSLGGGSGGLGLSIVGVTATQLVASGAHGYVLLDDGSVMSFGRNRSGERGVDVPENSGPTVITALGTTTTKLAAGGIAGQSRGIRFGCALDTAKTVSCWGANRHGVLGNGSNNNRDDDVIVPQTVIDTTDAPLAEVQDIAAGGTHACAIVGAVGKSDPKVVCWGRGTEGQVGSGVFDQNISRAQETLPAITNAASLGLGGRGSCAVLTTGALRCWGNVGGVTFTGPTAIDAFEP